MNQFDSKSEHIYPSWIDRAALVNTGLDLAYYRAKLDFITNRLGEKHLSWWEHKGSNQCQICDLIVIGYEILKEIDLITSKSALDSMTDSDYQYNCVLDQQPNELEDK